jgi:hypothetical protein
MCTLQVVDEVASKRAAAAPPLLTDPHPDSGGGWEQGNGPVGTYTTSIPHRFLVIPVANDRTIAMCSPASYVLNFQPWTTIGGGGPLRGDHVNSFASPLHVGDDCRFQG